MLLALVAAVNAATWAGTDFLSVLEEGYGRVESVHLKASVRSWVGPGFDSADVETVSEPGSFEYWAEGLRYRIICDAPRSLGSRGVLEDTEVAFDGELFQIVMRETSILSVQAAEPEFLPTALPNPFFLPLRFLVENLHVLRLQDLRGSPLWRARLRDAPQLPGVPDAAFLYAVDGRSATGEDVEYRLAVNAAGEIGRVEAHAKTGALLSAFEFAEYATVPAAGLAFPRQLVLHDYATGLLGRRSDSAESVATDPAGPAIHIEFQVETIETNTPIDPSVFTIDPAAVAYIWDSDASRYSKRPGT